MERQPAETHWPPMDEPVADRLVPTLDDLVNTIGARCCDLTEGQTEIGSRIDVAWWLKHHAPS